MRRWIWRILLAAALVASLAGTALAAETTISGGLKLTENGSAWAVSGYTGSSKTPVIPSSYEGKPVTSIAASAFENKGITQVTIPSSITTIGTNAFFGSKLAAVENPGTVTTIENSAFEQCTALTKVTFVDPAKSGGGASTTTIASRAFASCDNLVTLKLTGSISSIGP